LRNPRRPEQKRYSEGTLLKGEHRKEALSASVERRREKGKGEGKNVVGEKRELGLPQL